MPARRTPEIARYNGVAFLAHGDLGLIVWASDPTLEANRWLINHALRRYASKDESSLVLQLIAPSCPPPGPEARRLVQETFRTRLQSVRRMVTVPLGSSLAQSIVRTIMRGMIVFSGQSLRLTVASSIDEALDVLAPLSSPETPGRREILQDIQAIFDDLGVSEPVPRV